MAKPLIKIPNYPRVALVLQGGGALGAYQAGVYEGLVASGVQPNWLAGISIGSLNCAIIAGNPPEKRVERLHEFWRTICNPPLFTNGMLAQHEDLFSHASSPWADMMQGWSHALFGSLAATSSLMRGQDGFYKPRMLAPGGGSPDTTSFYDTSPIISTLERLADFDRINSGETRVSLGTTNVATGNFVYFDSKDIKLTPKHFIASGSLPPGFPATEIDGEYYWDGGCVSNTPLDYVLSQTPRSDTLVFQVDLWSARGPLPTDILQVNERLKDIQFSSRTRSVTNTVHLAQRMRQSLLDVIDRIPASVKEKDPWFNNMARHMMGARYNVIHLIYQNKQQEGHYKDYQFSAESMHMHWQTGLHDMKETFDYPECLAMPAEGENFVTFDVHTRQRTSSTQFQGANKAKSSKAPEVKPAAQKVAVRKAATKKAATKKAATKKVATKKAVSVKQPGTKRPAAKKATPSNSRRQPRQAPK
jgi:NTE family protein